MPILGAPLLVGAGAGGSTVAAGGAVAGGAAVSGSTLAGLAAVIGLGALLGGDTPKPAEAVAALTPDQLAERLKKVQEISKGLAATAAAACATGNCCQKTIVIPHSAAPQSARHIDDAQEMGFPRVLTYAADPSGARRRRYQSTKDIPGGNGLEPDEYPPAAFLENAGAAHVRLIDKTDNQTSGGIIGANLRGVPAGCRITLITGP